MTSACCRWAPGGFVRLLAIVLVPVPAAAQDTPPRPFAGAYLGLDVGRQNIIGGSLVGGVDVLQQTARVVGSVVAGLRAQLPMGVVLGGEIGFGRLNGDLVLDDPAAALRIDYRTRSQTHLGGTAGFALGRARSTLAFIYVLETSRTFSVTIQQASVTFQQTDGQGLLRYGVGVERAVGRWLSARATVGTSRADFGTRTTNIMPGNPLDASAAIMLRI